MLVHGEELTGKVKSVDASRYSLTLTIAGKDKTYPVDRDASIVHVVTMTNEKKNKSRDVVRSVESFESIKVGATITVLTAKEKDKREIITSVKLTGDALQSSDRPSKSKPSKPTKPGKTAKKKKSQPATPATETKN
jgi:hypothetical protein